MFEKPLGGTELMYNELFKRIPKFYLDKYSIFNYTTNADSNKHMIYWNQLSYDQEAVKLLQHSQNIDIIDKFVFVSNWQAEQFRKLFKIPGEKTHVIKNAHLGVYPKEITIKEKLKICYTSTPWRGLDVLLLAWEICNPQDCELHVFSSCKIYGSDFAKNDKQYEFLYDWCKRLTNVVYRGSIPNDELRRELVDFDILAYPSTFEETSCISVIEALSTGLRVITSSIGALPETCEGWARMYSYIENREEHGKYFANILAEEILNMKSGGLINHLRLQKEVYSNKWSWDSRIKEWEYLLNIKDDSFIFRNSWDSQLYTEVYTKNEYELDNLNENDIIIDIGSHIGSFTKLAFDKGSKNVFSYEANYSNYILSDKNLKDYPSNIKNLAVFRSDVDIDSIGFSIDLSSGNTGIGTVMVDSNEQVGVISLDNILKNFSTVRLLKIDVEGSEFPILLTSNYLDRIQEIVGEFHEIYDFSQISEKSIIPGYQKYSREDLIKYLSESGFHVEIKEVEWSNSIGFFRAKKINNNYE